MAALHVASNGPVTAGEKSGILGGMRQIVFAGSLLVDTVKTIPSWPERGMLVPITGIKRAVGGSACNTSIDLKTLDPSLDVRALGKVGRDDAGDFICSTLAAKGVDTSAVARTDTATTFTDVMTLETTGERTFFNMHGADSTLKADDVEVGGLSCDIFHLGYLLILDALDLPDPEYGTQAARLLARVQAAGIKTSLDLVSEKSARVPRIVRPALRHCDYLIVNEVEGEQVTGIPCRDAKGRLSPEALGRIAEALFALGVRRKVVLHSPEMGLARDAEGHVAAVPSLDLPPAWIKGAVGAGDAFCAGMLHAIMTDRPDDEGLRLASCAAAANLAAPDSVSGALPLAATLALEERFGRRKA